MSQQHQKQMKKQFEKGKLEQKKEDLEFIKKIDRKYCFEILLEERIKQLQKEIVGNSK